MLPQLLTTGSIVFGKIQNVLKIEGFLKHLSRGRGWSARSNRQASAYRQSTISVSRLLSFLQMACMTDLIQRP